MTSVGGRRARDAFVGDSVGLEERTPHRDRRAGPETEPQLLAGRQGAVGVRRADVESGHPVAVRRTRLVLHRFRLHRRRLPADLRGAAGRSGNLAPDGDFQKNDFIAWYQGKSSPYNPSQIVYGDCLYTLYDRGFLTCHDAKTGKEVYDRPRFSRLALSPRRRGRTAGGCSS